MTPTKPITATQLRKSLVDRNGPSPSAWVMPLDGEVWLATRYYAVVTDHGSRVQRLLENWNLPTDTDRIGEGYAITVEGAAVRYVECDNMPNLAAVITPTITRQNDKLLSRALLDGYEVTIDPASDWPQGLVPMDMYTESGDPAPSSDDGTRVLLSAEYYPIVSRSGELELWAGTPMKPVVARDGSGHALGIVMPFSA